MAAKSGGLRGVGREQKVLLLELHFSPSCWTSHHVPAANSYQASVEHQGTPMLGPGQATPLSARGLGLLRRYTSKHAK